MNFPQKTSKGEYYDVQVVNPSKLFKKYNIPKDFAVLSVDVEGTNNIVLPPLPSITPSSLLEEEATPNHSLCRRW